MARTQIDHYIPFFGRDFYASTATWTAEEVGHYIRLLVIQWDSGSLPAEIERLELVSPGVGRVWSLLGTKFPLCEDGQRRNLRMEEHREKACELKEARSEAGRNGNEKRWSDRKTIANGSQTDRKSDRKAIANGIAKTSPPSPSPSPSPNPEEKEENTHTPAASDEFRQPGWAAVEWERFAERWNRTERASPWNSLMAPSGWVERAVDGSWMAKADEALQRLPNCQWFDTPLAVTRFFEYVDRIIAGEFDNAKQDVRRKKQATGGNL